MCTKQIMPEGWNNENLKIDKNSIEECIKSNKTLQGIVEECDEKYNLHINLGDKIKGIMPREEIEAINTR